MHLAIFVTNMEKNKEIFAKNVKNKADLKNGFPLPMNKNFLCQKKPLYTKFQKTLLNTL